jgi:RimJ/RimL family protein N-acetyltransferase
MSLRLVHSEPIEEPQAAGPNAPRVVLGDEKNVVPWVERQLGLPAGFYVSAIAIGVVLGDRPVAGVLFVNYVRHRETGLVTVEVVIASAHPRWGTRAVLRFLFRYAFVHLKAARLQSIAPRKDKRARKLNERVGFKMEGVGRRALNGKDDVVVYSMLPKECRWLGGENG